MWAEKVCETAWIRRPKDGHDFRAVFICEWIKTRMERRVFPCFLADNCTICMENPSHSKSKQMRHCRLWEAQRVSVLHPRNVSCEFDSLHKDWFSNFVTFLNFRLWLRQVKIIFVSSIHSTIYKKKWQASIFVTFFSRESSIFIFFIVFTGK